MRKWDNTSVGSITRILWISLLVAVPCAVVVGAKHGPEAAVIVALAWLGVVAWAGLCLLCKHRQPKPGHCLWCGYSLTGLCRGVPCPECGRADDEPRRARRRKLGIAFAGLIVACGAAIVVFQPKITLFSGSLPIDINPTGIGLLVVLIGVSLGWVRWKTSPGR